MLTATQLTALKTELTTDPNGYGYAAPLAAGNHLAVAALVNQKRATIIVKRADVSAHDIFHALGVSDLIATPSSAQIAWLGALIQAQFQIRLVNDDGTDTPVRTNVLGLLAAGSTPTKTRLAALETRQGSRAEELFGVGTVVMVSDVSAAVIL